MNGPNNTHIYPPEPSIAFGFCVSSKPKARSDWEARLASGAKSVPKVLRAPGARPRVPSDRVAAACDDWDCATSCVARVGRSDGS